MYRLRETGVLHMRFFDRKKIRLLFGFTVFLVLLILNCVMYCNKAGMKRDLVVVIDVGHGGNDPGKIGVDNVKEKDVINIIENYQNKRKIVRITKKQC